jgi:hypothetical protein
VGQHYQYTRPEMQGGKKAFALVVNIIKTENNKERNNTKRGKEGRNGCDIRY